MSESGAGECALDSAVEELALKDEEDLDRKDDGVNGQEKQKDDDKEVLGTLLPLWYHIVARLLANERAAFIESCTAIGWKDCDSVRCCSNTKSSGWVLDKISVHG